MTRFALLFVVVVDLMGQGLILPAFTELLLDEDNSFFPAGTSAETRHLWFGVTIGAFFLSWFFGAAFISKLSDYIGRKAAINICLFGAFGGYVVTAVAVGLDSIWLLLVGRVIGGFTSGNQPIAQAALVDISTDDRDKTRNMGLYIVACAAGLVLGPLLAGLLSEPAIVGAAASFELPFIAAAITIVISYVLIVLFYRESGPPHRPIDFGPSEVFTTLLRIRDHPDVGRLSAVMFFFLVALNATYLFAAPYFDGRFEFDTLENGALIIVYGVFMGVGAKYVAPIFENRFKKAHVINWGGAMMVFGTGALLLNPIWWLSYLAMVPFAIGIAVAYPSFLSLFSAAVGPDEQGWVMGVTVALFTLGNAIISPLGGWLMVTNPALPFFGSIFAIGMMLLLKALLLQRPSIRELDPMETRP